MPATIEQIQNFKGKYPKQIWALFFSEMWERFCFYGMRGMLTYFMITQLFINDHDATLRYGATQAWVYAFTFIGGMLADKVLGFQRSLFWGGILMITGSLLLAYNPHQFFITGIAFNIVGTGFFKPNISSMVGMLYKQNDIRRDAGFNLFYAGINIGALLGGYFCIAIGKGTLASSLIPENLRWNVAFALAALVITISLITFIFTRKSLGDIGLNKVAPERKFKNNISVALVVIGSLAIIPVIMKLVSNIHYTDIFMMIIGPAALVLLFFEMRKLTKAENQKLIAALIFMVFSVLFWAIYEQAGGSLNIFSANNISSSFLGIITLDPNGVNNSANSFLVIGFAPVAGLVWLWLAKRKAEPNSVVKFGLSFLFLAVGFFILYIMKYFANAQGVSSMEIFIVSCFLTSIAEISISPIGLSLMTTLAPQKLQGYMMGMWFLSTAYGEYVSGIFGADISGKYDNADNVSKLIGYCNGYGHFAWIAVVAGIVVVIIAPLIRKLMHEVK